MGVSLTFQIKSRKRSSVPILKRVDTVLGKGETEVRPEVRPEIKFQVLAISVNVHFVVQFIFWMFNNSVSLSNFFILFLENTKEAFTKYDAETGESNRHRQVEIFYS